MLCNHTSYIIWQLCFTPPADFDQAYAAFCGEVIERVLLAPEKTMKLVNLLELFKKVACNQGVDASRYRKVTFYMFF